MMRNRGLSDRSLLDCLFQAVRGVILEMFHNINKSKNFVPGFVCVLHTFGHPSNGTHISIAWLLKAGLSDD